MPKIKIQYNRFLDPIFIAWIQSTEQWKDWKPASQDIVISRINAYKEIWGQYEHKILKGMCGAVNLSFVRNEIDVYIVNGNTRSFSRPIVMRSGYSPHEFVQTLTHELIHCLLSDNEDGYIEYIHGSFGSHVAVYSIMEYIFRDELDKPLWLEEVDPRKNKIPQPQHYIDAWEYVEKTGYRTVLEKIRSLIHIESN